jgi:hypothetical protein
MGLGFSIFLIAIRRFAVRATVSGVSVNTVGPSQRRGALGAGQGRIGEVLQKAFSMALSIVVFMTPPVELGQAL